MEYIIIIISSNFAILSELCDLRSIMRNRNIAEYQKPCLMVLLPFKCYNPKQVKSPQIPKPLQNWFSSSMDQCFPATIRYMYLEISLFIIFFTYYYPTFPLHIHCKVYATV